MYPILARNGAVVAPHSLASQAGLDILREGGNAIEATIAVAAALAVVYPHMTGIGGDNFWLLHTPDGAPCGIDACGAAGAAATSSLYAGLDAIPWRGPLAANTVAGAISGWGAAYEHSRKVWGGRLPFSRLLESAILYAREGFPVSQSQADTIAEKLGELAPQPGFAETFLIDGAPPAYGALSRRPTLAQTLEQLGRAGAQDFYSGDLARQIATDLAAAGCPLSLADLEAHQAQFRTPLWIETSAGWVMNLPPPTQELASLLILGLFDRIREPGWSPDNAAGVHALVEATKQAFRVRDAYVGDPGSSMVDSQALLAPETVNALAARMSLGAASPWPAPVSDGDTTWMGTIDAQGRAVSMIQSIYFEFGSGVVLPGFGINWQNRGCSFDLQPGRLRSLAPGRKPFHTLNPAMARLKDGRLFVYGAMGGEGQPQTQAAVFSRLAWGGHNVRSAIAAPRWLLGRTWAEPSVTLKLECRYPPEVVDALRALGHPVEVVGDYDVRMGHAGGLLLYPDGWIEGGEDPRSDGCVAGW